VFIFEAASEKEALKTSIDIAEFVAAETLVANRDKRQSIFYEART
jgi:hypothetical protein